MPIDLQKLEQKFNALFEDENFVTDFEQWLEARNVSQNSSKPYVSGSLPLSEVPAFTKFINEQQILWNEEDEVWEEYVGHDTPNVYSTDELYAMFTGNDH